MPARGRLLGWVGQTTDSNVPTPTTEYMTQYKCAYTTYSVACLRGGWQVPRPGKVMVGCPGADIWWVCVWCVGLRSGGKVSIN